MKEDLNLQCPYKVTKQPKDSTYYFTTISGIIYRAIFIKYGELFKGTVGEIFADNVYMFNIENVTPVIKLPSRDPGIFLTVECIIEHFFTNPDNILIYVCDVADKRELARSRMFNWWYLRAKNKSNYIKVADTIITDDADMYSAVIFKKDNAFNAEIIKACNDLNAQLKKD